MKLTEQTRQQKSASETKQRRPPAMGGSEVKRPCSLASIAGNGAITAAVQSVTGRPGRLECSASSPPILVVDRDTPNSAERAAGRSGIWGCFEAGKRTKVWLNVGATRVAGRFRAYTKTSDGGWANLDNGTIVESSGVGGTYRVVLSSGEVWSVGFTADGLTMSWWSDSRIMEFRKYSQGGVFDDPTSAEFGDDDEVEQDRRVGLEPGDRARLVEAAGEVLAAMRKFPKEGFGSQRYAIDEIVLRVWKHSVSDYSGELKSRAADFLLDELHGKSLSYQGKKWGADLHMRAILDGGGWARSRGPGRYRYRITLSGVTVGAKGIVGLKALQGMMKVEQLPGDGVDPWTKHYQFILGSVIGTLGGGASVGGDRKVFEVETNTAWSQKDFKFAVFRGGVAKAGQLSATAGPLKLGEATAVEVKRLQLISGRGVLELAASLSHWNLEYIGKEGVEVSEAAEVGLRAGFSAGEVAVEGGMAIPLAGEDYLKDPAVSRPTNQRDVVARPAPQSLNYRSGSAEASPAALGPVEQSVLRWSASVLENPKSLEITGHASLQWEGKGDARDTYHGEIMNRALSKRRAEAVAAAIAELFGGHGLTVDSFTVSGAGADEAHNAKDTTDKNDPRFRRVDIHLHGRRIHTLHY